MTSGMSYVKVLRMFRLLNLAGISESTIQNYAKKFIQPIVYSIWQQERRAILQQVQNSGGVLVLAGDGRADTPGHCAKYGTYTLLDLNVKKIIEIQLVQVHPLATISLVIDSYRSV